MNNLAELVSETIDRLKNPHDLKNCYRIPFYKDRESAGYLRPVTSVLAGAASYDNYLMSEWRNLNKESYFTWIATTPNSTADWLTQIYAKNNQDIIFMVESIEKTPFGHLALYNFNFDTRTCELGRVVRGLKTVSRGGMTLATRSLLSWASSNLDINNFILQVFENNKQAIALYERCDFHKVKRIPLKRIDFPNVIKWEQIKTPDKLSICADSYAIIMKAEFIKMDSLLQSVV